jgi:CarD family transcriptional regulator
MFNIGDKIVYPMHGAGVIESIEEKEILGIKQSYYIVQMPINDMKIMIPITNADGVGIRDVISNQEADKVFEALCHNKGCINSNWNKRYRENMIKIKSGNIFEVADVVSSLMGIERDKGLSTGERKMLNNAKQILISELILAKGVDRIEIENIISTNFRFDDKMSG